MCGTVPPLRNTPSCRDAQLKHRDNFTFTSVVFARFSVSVDDFRKRRKAILCASEEFFKLFCVLCNFKVKQHSCGFFFSFRNFAGNIVTVTE
jgi:hypothetical protein